MNSYLTLLLLSTLVSDIFAYPSNRLLKRDEEFRELNEEGNEMICRLNALRRENGKKNMLLDYRITAAAQKHAEAMKQHQTLSHEGFTPETKGFMDRIHLEGYKGGAGAENVCQGAKNAADTIKCWKNSPGHFENMMGDSDCFGYGREDIYSVQDFASGEACQGYGDIDCTKYGIDEGLKQTVEGDGSQPGDKKPEEEKPEDKKLGKELNTTTPNNSSLNEEGKEMICRLNALRRENGKRDVLLDHRIMLAAQKHAEAMKQHQTLSHEGFTPETKGFMDRIHLEGYKGGAGGENICQGSGNIVDVLNCWKNSLNHFKIMMTDYQCFGYGRDHEFWVQDFASGDKCIGYGDINCSKYGIDESLKQPLEGEKHQLEDKNQKVKN